MKTKAKPRPKPGSIGQRIRERREALGLLQRDVQQRCDFGTLISEYELDKKQPSLRNLVKLAAALETTPNTILGVS